jgi:aerobic carbon-monoxide dehydrogenase medium subunit
VYPSRFRYEAPRTLDQAIDLLHRGAGEAKVLAGGQSLIPLLKLRFAAPEVLVDINGLPDLDYHRLDPDGTIRVGALCRHVSLERSALLAGKQPTMAAAAPLIADPIVRNRGTLVGSLCHADPQGDWASVVTALGGHVVAAGPGGRRTIPIADFVTGPFQTVLDLDEVAVEAVIPAPSGTPAGGYLKLERRVGDFADAAQALVGKALTAASIESAAELAAAAARPRTDHRGSADYKRQVVRTFVVRILSRVVDAQERAA